MAKSQKKRNREAKKPKQDKAKRTPVIQPVTPEPVKKA